MVTNGIRGNGLGTGGERVGAGEHLLLHPPQEWADEIRMSLNRSIEVLLVEDNPGDVRLTAYVVVRQGESFTTTGLRRHLRTRWR